MVSSMAPQRMTWTTSSRPSRQILIEIRLCFTFMVDSLMWHGRCRPPNLTQRYQGIHTYQIFFIWETGVTEVIQQEGGVLGFIEAQLELVGKEEIFRQLLMRVLQFAKAKVESVNAGGTRSADSGLDLPDGAYVWKEFDAPKDGREPFSDV